MKTGVNPFYNLSRLIESLQLDDSMDDVRYELEHIRIGFAIDRHKKNIERLKIMIQKAKADHESLTVPKFGKL